MILTSFALLPFVSAHFSRASVVASKHGMWKTKQISLLRRGTLAQFDGCFDTTETDTVNGNFTINCVSLQEGNRSNVMTSAFYHKKDY
jgi:hypothetical protein